MTNILLRTVIETDLPIFFGQQLDPQATALADFPARDRGPFMVHWEKITRDKAVIVRTIVFKRRVAGHILSWKQEYDQNVGYWLGREYWGRGIASAALAAFLKQVNIRPLYAHVANHNMASRRVLEKCGFEIFHESKEEIILKLSVLQRSAILEASSQT